MANISVELFGKRLQNPIMNASGTLGYGKEIESLWDLGKIGAFVTKGLSLKPYHGNKPPRIKEERAALLNRIGLQNIGLERFIDEYLPLFKEKRLPVIINFFGFTEDDYVAFAECVKEDPYILALEMNLSCPNIKKGGLSFGRDLESLSRVTKAVRKATSIPLIVKLSPLVSDPLELALAAQEAGANGITLSNTIPCSSIEDDFRIFSYGLSGPALKPIALKAIHEASKRVSIPIIGCGGIMDLFDALSFFLAGAKAIQIGTATFIDPFTIPNIIDGLERYLKEKEKDMDDLRGTAYEA